MNRACRALPALITYGDAPRQPPRTLAASAGVCAPLCWVMLGFGLLTILATVPLLALDLDTTVERHFWSPPHAWAGLHDSSCRFFNDYGEVVGLAVFLGAAALAVAAMLLRALRSALRPALFLVLTFVLGPGLMVNGVLKHSWLRERPKESTVFGGKNAPRFQFAFNMAGRSHSFASGHTATGFYLSGLAFISMAAGRPRIAWLILTMVLVWTALIAWARLATGAHFPTDVLWGAALAGLVNCGSVPWLCGQVRAQPP